MKKVICMLLCAGLLLSVLLPSAVFAGSAGADVPVLTIARRPVPDNAAMDFLKDMGVGWNLGNTFDAVKGDWNRNADEMTVETSWVGVRTTREIFAALREAGYGTVRIPVSWHDHVSGDSYTISARWLDRVQEVVDWALEEDLYVILNIHHDEDWFLPSSAHYEESSRYVGGIWEQLSARFRDYDQKLIFESMNEPRLVGSRYEWNFDRNSPECLDAADCLNRLNQLFVDTVRASGGNNAGRYLMVPGYDASPAGATGDHFVLPADSAENRIIVSVHAYTPYSFALQQGGTHSFGSTAQKQEIAVFMNSLYDRYITRGVPVVIGEFGAMDKQGNLQDRVDFTAFYTATASARNIPCIWWDNGAFAGNGEIFGILDRTRAQFIYPEIVQAMITYGGYDTLSDPQ
ncbi:MAG: glycoside hydrolase family 5 protein [Clostridia bacterium]|nr:glycoside hydrolase family 5 protein [Clostridia bacterium]